MIPNHDYPASDDSLIQSQELISFRYQKIRGIAPQLSPLFFSIYTQKIYSSALYHTTALRSSRDISNKILPNNTPPNTQSYPSCPVQESTARDVLGELDQV
jgi:hypothetical protein